MLKYYIENVACQPDPAFYPEELRLVPDWRKKYILKYRQPKDRKLSVGVWKLLDRALTEYGLSASDVYIGKTGKPLHPEICFNLSHSADMAMCVLSEKNVGCDIELMISPHISSFERFFTEKEQEYICRAKSSSETNQRFFRLWTMKESYLKMTGEGIIVPLNSVEVYPERLSVKRFGRVQECTFNCMFKDNYAISICEIN